MTRPPLLAVLATFALATTAPAEPLLVSRTAAFANPADAAAAAEGQCTLAEFQAEAVMERLFAVGIDAVSSGNDEIPAHGKFLSLRIDSTRMVGGKFSANVTTTARLFESGAEVAHFTETRSTVRGIPGAGHASSCRMPAACARALAGDIAAWLKGELAPRRTEAERAAPR